MNHPWVAVFPLLLASPRTVMHCRVAAILSASRAMFPLSSLSPPPPPPRVAASAVSQSGTVDSDGATAERAGWDMQDVLLRLGAVPGEYLTHIIMVRQAGVRRARTQCVDQREGDYWLPIL